MTRRKIALVALIAAALAALLTTATWASGRSASSGMGMMGGHGRGAGMMDDRGGMMGGAGMMNAYVLPGNGVRVDSLDAARQRAELFADRWGLRVGEVMRFDNGFYAELETTLRQGATEVLIDRASGAVQLEYGPAMMWNTEYGMHAGSASTPTRVSAEEAAGIAQRWLDGQRPGLTAGEPEAFPGYCTMHTQDEAAVAGMMSVNAYSGAVWYHTWHGRFVGMSED